MRFHKIQNVQIALDFLRLKGVSGIFHIILLCVLFYLYGNLLFFM